MRISVVVLGDLQRSPRMMNHAHALAANNVHVDLIGYAGSLPYAAERDPRISCHLLADPHTSWTHESDAGHATPMFARARWALAAGARAVLEGWRLFAALMHVPRPHVILVQTPPAVPTLAIALLAARLRSARLVIDWHNLTDSLIALRFGDHHPLVRFIAWYERVCGRLASAGLAVSHALRNHLDASGVGRVHVMRDRPGDVFQRTAPAAGAALMTHIFGAPHARLVVVPSSWSLDDDFELLLAAIERCESLISRQEREHPGRPFPSVGIVLTGNGPLRATFQARFENRPHQRLHVRAIWLSAEEYVQLIGAADLGISVHRSSSGLDLPMKICDLFGGGVPVCALNYGPCLSELVQDGVNGALFRTADELAELLCTLLDDEPRASATIERLQRGAAAAGLVRWRQAWTADAWPVLSGMPGA